MNGSAEGSTNPYTAQQIRLETSFPLLIHLYQVDDVFHAIAYARMLSSEC